MNFSVLISIYYKEKPDYLDQALNSVYFDQTIKPSEIVLVEDGVLTSDLYSIINKWKSIIKEKLITVKIPSNVGLGKALNIGLEKCNFELIARMDTDDIADSKRFEKQLNLIKENKDISILGSYIQEFNTIPGDLNQIRKVPSNIIDINSIKKLRNPFNHVTIFFKKFAVKDVGGYKDMPGYEDYYLWLRLLKKYNGLNMTENLVFVRIGNDMIGKRQGLRFVLNEINFQKTILNEKLISPLDFILNIFLRIFPRFLPKFLLKILYKTFLRN